jgi:hypothetical protein
MGLMSKAPFEPCWVEIFSQRRAGAPQGEEEEKRRGARD